MTVKHDFSDFPDQLKRFAIAQMCHRSILEYDGIEIGEAHDANSIRISIIEEDEFNSWRWWVGFSAAVEALVKSVFMKNEISMMKKRVLLPKGPGGSKPLATAVASEVYSFISNTEVTSKSNPWLKSEFCRLGIEHPYEINTDTLGKYIMALAKKNGPSGLGESDTVFVKDALCVLSDMRRNVDAHGTLKTQVVGSIQGDLSNVYIPAINMLLKAY